MKPVRIAWFIFVTVHLVELDGMVTSGLFNLFGDNRGLEAKARL